MERREFVQGVISGVLGAGAIEAVFSGRLPTRDESQITEKVPVEQDIAIHNIQFGYVRGIVRVKDTEWLYTIGYEAIRRCFIVTFCEDKLDLAVRGCAILISDYAIANDHIPETSNALLEVAMAALHNAGGIDKYAVKTPCGTNFHIVATIFNTTA